MNVLVTLILATTMVFWSGNAPSGSPQDNLPNNAAYQAEDRQPESPVCPVIRVHTVREGENLSVIAENYRLDLETLLAANNEIGEIIYPGDQLNILPQKGTLYIVEKDDTIGGIAQMHGVPPAAILAANAKKSEELSIGEKIFVPGVRPVKASRGGTARFAWPVRGELSSPFGYRWGRLHAGIDIAADTGTAVRAAKTGRVTFAGWRGGYGNAVMIEHGQGYGTLYGHLSKYLVASGQYVSAGELVGLVGTTGNSTGPHLHFEINVDGQPVNPVLFLP